MTGNEELKTVACCFYDYALLPQKAQIAAGKTLSRLCVFAGIRPIAEGKVSVGQR